jgi:2-dehydropantoate 2-reductase
MRTLIVGIGALGGIISARLIAAGDRVWMATRTPEAAAKLRASGLQVTGIGDAVSVNPTEVRPLADYFAADSFDLIVLATKASDAIEAVPKLSEMLAPGSTLLPIQNGGVSQMLVDLLGEERVLGGLSNLGATMTELGRYEQRNAGHLLIGEISGGESQRAESIRRWLGRAVDVKVTSNLRGAIWSKLILNCSVTTLGAVAGQTMRAYVALPEGRQLFDRTYDEALSVALANGTQLEKMIVDPVPPTWNKAESRSFPGEAYNNWLQQVLKGYGDIKPSMLQDFERGRVTEIDFINGYVADLGKKLNVRTPANAAIVDTVHAISRGQTTPSANLLGIILRASTESTALS